MPCYCSTIQKYSADLTILEGVRESVIKISDDFTSGYRKLKDDLKVFFDQSSPYQFRINEVSQLKTNIDDYEKTLAGNNNDFNKLIDDLDTAIAYAKSQKNNYEQWDREYHAKTANT